MNKKYKFILMLLIVLFAISSYFFIKEIAENKKENNIYEDLQEIVKNEENSIQENDYTNASEDKSDNISTENNTNPDGFYNLENISKINTDVIGWIKINGTNIIFTDENGTEWNGTMRREEAGNLALKISKNGEKVTLYDEEGD